MSKYFTLIFISLFILRNTCNAQISDSALVKKLSIEGVCLCNTTLSSLTKKNNNFKEIEVEEMDLSKSCIGQDSRFIAGKGYFSEAYPGMIFQKDQNTDQISKIRLTKSFRGKLPDGKSINMQNFLLKDLLKMYPKLKDTWGSRGCSDYWNFSNDTLSFYVKIDKNKQPQFPVDEAYYFDKPVEAADLVISCYSFENKTTSPVVLFDPNEPVFFLDSIRVNKAVLANYVPSEISSVTVYKGDNAIKRIGAEGKNGLIYIQTKVFAKQLYWNYFKLKSKEYARIVPDAQNDRLIQYVLNSKLLKDNYESDLAAINDSTFKEITIIDKDQLVKQYGVNDKNYGVIIVADIPNKSKK
jgi:hypothetical protein